MTFEVPAQPRIEGDEHARTHLFGKDAASTTSVTDLRAGLAERGRRLAVVLSSTAELMEAHVADIDTKGMLVQALNAVRTASQELAVCGDRLAARDVDRPFRVVLMGRTMAGKSTLFEFLSEGDGTRVGKGGQRTTTVSCSREAVGLGFEVVDTPGVGAMDGEVDYTTAFAEVPDADLILWVATDQATQEQTGRALECLADLGKPIVVALNCLVDVKDEVGLADMLEEPERVFGGDAEGNLAPIRRHLDKAGGRYLCAVPIHAQAALVATAGEFSDEDATVLRKNSQVDQLISVLGEQRDRTASQRRIVSAFDFARVAFLDSAGALTSAVALLSAALEASAGSQVALKKRALRRIEDAHDEISTAIADAILRRERWIEDVDVDLPIERINKKWNAEMEALRAELDSVVVEVADRLKGDLDKIAGDVADDWAEFEPRRFKGVGGRGEIWANRAVKVGGRVAAGLAAAAGGAKVGAFAGGFFGPGVGNVIGAGVGALAGFAAVMLGLNIVIDWIADTFWRSASQVRERRRRRISAQLTPILKQLSDDLAAANLTVRQQWESAILADLASQADACGAVGRARDELEQALKQVDAEVAEVDRDLSRELLGVAGRTRVANAVVRATRWRGAGIAVELAEPAFSELVLFPAAQVVEAIVPTSSLASPAAGALQVIRSLTERPVTVRRMNTSGLVVELDDPPAAGAQEAWTALACLHSGVAVQINPETAQEVPDGDDSCP